MQLTVFQVTWSLNCTILKKKQKQNPKKQQTTIVSESIHLKFSLSCSEQVFPIQILWKFSIIILALGDGGCHTEIKKLTLKKIPE